MWLWPSISASIWQRSKSFFCGSSAFGQAARFFYLHLCGIIIKTPSGGTLWHRKQTPEEREAELARREAALAAREAQLAQEQAELAGRKADFEEGKKSLLNNGDKNFVNAKEKMYDHFPLTVHQMDIIIRVLFALIALFLVLGVTHTSFFGLFGG